MSTQQRINISVSEVRKHLAELVEEVHYNDKTIQIVRQNKTMAFLVGNNFIEALEQIFKQDPALQETIEILMNETDKNDLFESQAEYQESGAPITLVKRQ